MYTFQQMVVYITFGTNSAAVEHSVLALYGMKEFQWMKWCNKFTRFCFQIGGALVCGYLACALMVLVTSISAFNLFRLYSPEKFLRLKSTWWICFLTLQETAFYYFIMKSQILFVIKYFNNYINTWFLLH